MREARRNFWRWWWQRVRPGAVVLGMFVTGLLLLAFYGDGSGAGPLVMSAALLSAMFLGIAMFSGAKHLRTLDQFFAAHPDRLDLLDEDHLYEPPRPIHLHFDDAPAAVRQRLTDALVERVPTVNEGNTWRMESTWPERRIAVECSCTLRAGKDGALLTVELSPDAFVGSTRGLQLFFEVIDGASEAGARPPTLTTWRRSAAVA